MPGRKATFAPCSSAGSWPIAPSISSDAKIRPGTRIPALYSLGRSQRQSSIFWRMSFQLAAISLLRCRTRPVPGNRRPPAPPVRRLFHVEAGEQHLLRVQVVQELRQPAYEECLAVARLDIDLALFGLADAAEVRHEAEHAGGGVGEQVLQASGVGDDPRVGGGLQDLEGGGR